MAEQVSTAAATDYSYIEPSLRRDAEEYSEKQGVSLKEFINLALAERLDHLRHQEWMSKRSPMTEERRAGFLALLAKSGAGSDEVKPGDELPEGYVRS